MKYNLKNLVKRALICDKGCGHKLDPEICFNHQIQRIKELIEIEADSWANINPFDIKVPSGWRMGQTLFNFLEWLTQAKGYAPTSKPRMADPFHIPNDLFLQLYEEFLKIHTKHEKR